MIHSEQENETVLAGLGGELSPPVVLQAIRLEQRRTIWVARDDQLPGGTKQRACAPFLQELSDGGYSTFLYASPFSGFAQVALAFVCAKLNLKCVIACERDPTTGELHAFSRLAESFGAKIVVVSSLMEAEAVSLEIEARSAGAFKIPLGFDCERYRELLGIQLRKEILRAYQLLNKTPQRLWVSLGSGTLVRTFDRLLPRETSICAVNVHVLVESDPRIVAASAMARVQLFAAPMRFCEPARSPPNIPSNAFYDAKLWEFLADYARDGDLWWNVAR